MRLKKISAREDNVLSVRSLNTEYPSRKGPPVKAVQNVTFDVPERELFTLPGPSGCGKTTPLRSIAGLETPTSGEIQVGGRIVYSSQKGVFVAPNKRDFGMAFQSYAIWPHMNVFQNAAFPLEVRSGKQTGKQIRDKVMRVLNAWSSPCAPEDVELSDAPPANADPYNLCAGIVDQKVFLGEYVDFQIKVGETVLLARAHASVRTPIGDSIHIRMNPEKCVAIPDAAPAREAA